MTLREGSIIGVITGALALIGATALTVWLLSDPTRAFTEHLPGRDGRAAAISNAPTVVIGQYFTPGTGTPPRGFSGHWPRFRGAHFDNILTDTVALADAWGPQGPPVLWSLDLGEGHAAPAIDAGRVYVLDYDETNRADALRCLSLADGSELWRRWYKVNLKRNHGMSRTVPAISGNYVVTIGPNCHVMCVDADSGALRWSIDMVKDYGSKVPGWYTGQCPLIDDGLAILAPAGSNVLMMAVDCASGAVVWQTPNPRGWQMSHSSIMPWTLAGVTMYVYCAVGGLAGIAASGPDRGRILWETSEWNHNVVAPSPVCMPDGRLLITAGYSGGSMLFRVSLSNGVFTIAKLHAYRPNEGIASEQQTPIFYQNRLFAVLPKDAGPHRNEFVCCDPSDCSSFLWTSGRANRFGLGPYMIADGKFFILSDDAVLTMLRATTNGYQELARASIMKGRDAWGPFAIADGRMLLRDDRRLVCLDLRRSSTEAQP